MGKLKEKYFTEGIRYFSKIIAKEAPFCIIECADEATPESASAATEKQIRNVEGERILSQLKSDDYVIALCIDGVKQSSERFFQKLRLTMRRLSNNANVVFIIGGSLGLSDAVVKRANERISFSNMTFPHQLMRLILCEQLAKYLKI